MTSHGENGVQPSIQKLLALGTPLTEATSDRQLAEADDHLAHLAYPLSDADIRALLRLLPPDGNAARGLNWSVVHAIEACDTWPIPDWRQRADEDHQWFAILRHRLSE